MTTRDIIKSFYDSLALKNDGWQKDLSEDVVFSDASLSLHAVGKAAFIQAFIPFLRAVETVRIKQIIVEGNDVCVIASYDYVSPKGGKLNQDDAEVWKVEDGKLMSLTLYFDLTAFRNFMGR